MLELVGVITVSCFIFIFYILQMAWPGICFWIRRFAINSDIVDTRHCLHEEEIWKLKKTYSGPSSPWENFVILIFLLCWFIFNSYSKYSPVNTALFCWTPSIAPPSLSHPSLGAGCLCQVPADLHSIRLIGGQRRHQGSFTVWSP